MLIILSPAKTLDFDSARVISESSVPDFLPQASELMQLLKSYKVSELKPLMSISDKLALLNYERFQLWVPEKTGLSRQAICAFKGEVYSGLNVADWSDGDFSFAQQHIRILSGLYGVLRPLDFINPFRLEIGMKFPNKKGNSLYDFWGYKITSNIVDQLNRQGDKILVNLASNEYFKAINEKQTLARIITPVFKDFSGGNYKIVSIFAKKTRGMMARFIVKNQLTDPEMLKHFTDDGYYYNDRLTKGDQWVFTRD